MEKKKLSLEDLKLESFLTEIDNSKLVKVQGGNGAYENDWSEDGCYSGDGNCDTPGYSNEAGNCEGQSVDACSCECTADCTQTLQSDDCDGGSGEVQC